MQAGTKGGVAKAVPWTCLQEVMFDDFFGQRLSYEGFTIEKVGGGYQVSSNATASSSELTTVMVQKAEPSLHKVVACVPTLPGLTVRND